jgi:hypothetical protein
LLSFLSFIIKLSYFTIEIHIYISNGIAIALAGCDSAKEGSTPQTSSTPVPAATDVKTEKAASQVNYTLYQKDEVSCY